MYQPNNKGSLDTLYDCTAKYDEKAIVHCLLAISDVTEEKEHELEQDRILRNALSSAEHANRAKNSFFK